jgi:toxin YoeB
MTKYPGDEPDQNLRKSVRTDLFKEDLKYWQKNDPKKLKRIHNLMEAIMHDPFKGIGKPEHLKYEGADVWSRRINDKHRIVYLVSPDQIDFLQARHHYTNN